MELSEITILVVEDEFPIRDAIITTLKYEGFKVIEAEDGLAALNKIRTQNIDLIILDVMLPKLDGFKLVKTIRESGQKVPVLFVSAKDDVSDRIEGLSIGGDDYVVKPFSLAELMARVNAILRRTKSDTGSVLRFLDVRVDLNSYEVFRDDKKIEVTPTEFNLLKFFMHHPKKVLSKTEIAQAIWDYDFGGDYNIVEAYISYLRKKLEKYGPPIIYTVRGVGYILKEPQL